MFEGEITSQPVPNKVTALGLTYFGLRKLFPNKQAVIQYFISCRYGQDITCNHCKSSAVRRRGLSQFFTCRHCNNSFSIFKGTILEHTKLDLTKWTYAIHLVLNAKKRISGCQLHRDLGGSYKTSWRMLKQIRKAMNQERNRRLFDAIVEIDETYVGGKPRKGWDAKTTGESKRGRGSRKTQVVGIFERATGEVYAQVALPNKMKEKLTGKQLFRIIDKVVKKSAIHMTDEFTGYRILDKINLTHLVIDHKKGFVNSGFIHTNSMESFWANMKRGIIGSYHHISPKYLQTYIDEFSWRFSNRKNENIFHDYMKRTVVAATVTV